MPSETTVPVSKETLKLVNEYKKEFAFKSLDEAVENAIRWAKLWNYVDSQTRRDMQSRINDLEFRLEELEKSQN